MNDQDRQDRRDKAEIEALKDNSAALAASARAMSEEVKTPGVAAVAVGSANWTRATADSLPEHTNWVLIVIDGKPREVPDHLGLGWRKRDSAGRATGGWETSHGLMMDRHINYWAEPPSLPKH